eukprot:7112679-Prymnesium_polylepis.1
MRHGAYASREAWLPASTPDPWHRTPAFMGSDAERTGDGISAGALVDEPRIFMDGLSDEAGAAAPLAMAAKQLGAPVASEVAQLEEYVHETLWTPPGANRSHYLQGRDYAVRASMAFWSDELQAEPQAARAAAPALAAACIQCWSSCPKRRDCCNWMPGGAALHTPPSTKLSRGLSTRPRAVRLAERSLETWRAYNYPHVVVVYWSLYRLARHYSPPLARRASWQWYLLQAARTAAAMWTFGGKGTGTSQWGLMVGSIFRRVLVDLEREIAAADEASGVNVTAIEEARNAMQLLRGARMRRWLAMEFPYGSEFPWDSTGHEEIH